MTLSLAAIVRAWPADGWRFTAGWASSGSILVGVLAIAASAIFNVKTLKRAEENLQLAQQAYSRTEDRYRADRVQAKNDQVLVAVVDVVSQVGGWIARLIELQRVLWEHALLIRRDGSPDAVAGSLQAIMTFQLSRMEPAIQLASAALLTAGFVSDGQDRIQGELQRLEGTFGQAILDPPVPGGDFESEDYFRGWADGITLRRQIISDHLEQLVAVTRAALPRWDPDV
jgi:hypothetical protein